MQKRLTILFLIIYSISCSVFFSQSIDDLKISISEKNGREKVKLQIELAKKYFDRSDFVKGLKNANEALEQSKLLKDKGLIIRANAIIAKGSIIVGNLPEASKTINKVDSLAREINDVYGLGISCQIRGQVNIYQGKTELGLNQLDSSLIFLNTEEFLAEKGVTLQTKAAILGMMGNVDSCLALFDKSVAIFRSIKDDYKYATALLNKSLAQSSISGKIEGAISNTLIALTYFENLKDTLKIATSNNVIGSCYDLIGNYDKSIEYYQKAIELAAMKQNSILLSNFYNNLGEVYKHKSDFKTAMEYYKKSLQIFTEYQIIEGITVTENNIGECLFALENNSEALIYFNRSLNNVINSNDNYKLTIIYNNIGKVYLSENKNRSAIDYFKKALLFGEGVAQIEEVFPIHENLAKAYKSTGSSKMALKHLEKFVEMKNEYTKKNNAERLTEIETKYQTERKEKEIQLLTKSKEINELKIAAQTKISFALIVIIVLGAILVLIFIKRYKDKKRHNELLSEQNQLIENQANELKLANEQLLNSEKNLKELNATKDKFFSIIAHDLKGPFTSLLGLSEIMKENIFEFSREEIKDMSSGINNALKKVFSLVENLLEWSKTQLGIIQINKQEFDFNLLVVENEKLYKNQLEKKNISISKELNSYSKILADKDMINFVLRNLLNNAIKFTEPNGKINIDSSVKEKKLFVNVSDNGIGIPEENIKQLFKIDSTFSTIGTQQEAGTGLGLILVKEFLEKNGGSISVESKVNQGTKFTFSVPCSN
ncbi:MAG: tetratricopeptide repeat-containing sensor histidine kinase [Melioribacteraceae bacterium]|nr:tetratricopeptide repeat-containing sensor histidine kinase [Melioribacteraceae bacterium]